MLQKYTLAQDLIPLLKDKLEKFVKKYSKYVSCYFTSSEPYKCNDRLSPWYRCMLVDIELEASYKLGDYEFVCSLEYNEEAGENLIKKPNDDVYVPSIYKYRKQCDHCKTNRKRKSTILLKNVVNGDYVQVGKSCVKEYIGIDIGNYASYLSFFKDIDEYIDSCKHNTAIRYTVMYSTEEVLLQAIEEVRHHGYISKQQSWDLDTDSTSSRVYQAVTNFTPHGQKSPLYSIYEVTQDTLDSYYELIDFYENLPNEEITDYINNIKTLLKTENLDVKNIGILVSSIGCKLHIENQRKEKENKLCSKWVGNIGDRISFTATPKCVFSSETEYGYYYIYRMSVDGNEIVWKTNRFLNTEYEYEFTATVKSQDEYKGIKQTEVTRARVK